MESVADCRDAAKWFVKGVAALTLVASVVVAQDDPTTLQARFLEEAPKASELLGKLTFRAVSTLRQTYTTSSSEHLRLFRERYGDSGKPPDETFETVSLDRMTKETGVDNGIEYIVSRNPTYAFRITRGSDSDQWAITWVEANGANPAADQLVADQTRQGLAFPLAAGFPFGMTMKELIESPDFRLIQVVPEEGAVGLVRVEFDFLPADERMHHTDAYLICDPDREWAVKEFRAHLGAEGVSRGSIKTVIEFSDTASLFPLASSVTSIMDGDRPGDPELSLERMIAVTIKDPPNVTESEFYLSHYGLPEPNFETKWFHSWMVYLIGGIACLTLAYLIHQRRQLTE